MAFFWKLPPVGAVKVNVHGATPFMPFFNGNTTSLGMIVRNCEGELLKLSTGTIPHLSPLQNQLQAIHYGLIKAFEDDYQKVILEIDNIEAFQTLKNYPHGVAEDVKEVTEQILILLHDPRWACAVMYVFPGRNKTAAYLARLGGEKCSELFTFTRPVGALETFLSLDLGFGSLDERFADTIITNDQEDPVDFGPQTLAPAALIHGGYAFREDFFAIHNDVLDIPEVVPVHEATVEEYLLGNGKNAAEFNGDLMFSY